MKLRKPCKAHDRYEAHQVVTGDPRFPIVLCPGGVFLPDDTLVIEKVDGEWPESARLAIRSELWKEPNWTLNSILDALSVREAE